MVECTYCKWLWIKVSAKWNVMYLHDRVVTAMLAVRENWLSSVTQVWGGANTELLMVIVRSWLGEPFPGRKSSTSTERCLSDSQTFLLLTVFQTGEKWELVGCHLRSCFRKSHVSEQSRESWCTKREKGRNQDGTLRDPSRKRTRFWHIYSPNYPVSEV